MWTEEQRDRYRVERKRHPSDLTDAEWTQIEDLFASYESYSHTLRELVNACLYLGAEGCRWQSLPKDFPPSAPSAGGGTASAARASGNGPRPGLSGILCRAALIR